MASRDSDVRKLPRRSSPKNSGNRKSEALKKSEESSWDGAFEV